MTSKPVNQAMNTPKKSPASKKFPLLTLLAATLFAASCLYPEEDRLLADITWERWAISFGIKAVTGGEVEGIPKEVATDYFDINSLEEGLLDHHGGIGIYYCYSGERNWCEGFHNPEWWIGLVGKDWCEFITTMNSGIHTGGYGAQIIELEEEGCVFADPSCQDPCPETGIHWDVTP